MNHEFASAMRRANELVRAGDPAAATKLIQSSLRGADLGNSQPMPAPSSNGFTPSDLLSPRKGGLRQTLADLAAKMPASSRTGFDAPMPPMPEGARFDGSTFACSAGSRDYRVYVPKLRAAPAKGMIMMLHGCTQSPVDFANGTRMNHLADEHGLIIVYPAQSRGANMQSCWNWFDRADQDRGAGEPAILAGLADKIRGEHDIPQGKTFVAGLSAGAAMAVILGRTYPDIFAGVGAHSGLPYKSAHDVASAFSAMGGAVSAPSSAPDTTVPTIVFHGNADATVSPSNGQRIAADYHSSGAEILDSGAIGGRKFSRMTVFSEGGPAALEYWRIDGLGHAWSGGNSAGSYADPQGPDASSEMVRFFVDLAPQ